MYTQNSRTGDIVYADIGPNTAKAVHQWNLTLLNDDRVQYEEIRHETGALVCEPQTSGEILGIQFIMV